MSPVSRVASFSALSGFAALRWGDLIDPTERWRAVGSLGVALAFALAIVPLRRRRGMVAVVPAALLAVVGVALAAGIPAAAIWPPGWGDLASGLGHGISSLPDITFPYRDGDLWVQRVLLLGAPILLGGAAVIAFRRGTAVAGPRIVPLGLCLFAYALATTLSPPDLPLLDGSVLMALMAAWLWLPVIRPGSVIPTAAAIALACIVALPLATRVDAKEPWLDYANWNLFGGSSSNQEFFGWDQTYGPIDWPRTGRKMFEVQSNAPHYWRTVTLPQFDGFRWSGSTTDYPEVDVPPRSAGSGAAPLRKAWIHRIGIHLDDLTTSAVVGAGSILGVRGIDKTEHTGDAVRVPSGDSPLSSGDEYALRVYTPDPTPGEMRAAPAAFGPALRPFTEMSIPVKRINTDASVSVNGPAAPQSNSLDPSVQTTVVRVEPPPWVDAHGTRGRALRQIARSPYGPVLALAQRVSARARTPYDAATAIGDYLRSSYDYSETPPEREYPLRAFLLRDRIGYCQQFSGAMALMLRMVGIPARVASGFSPGVRKGSRYVVTDFDAHAWVEVWFSGIGWVPFDPTPGAAPAQNRPATAGAAIESPRGRPLPKLGDAPGVRDPSGGAASSGESGPNLLLRIAPIVLALILGAAVWWGARRRSITRLGPTERARAQAHELIDAMRRAPGSSMRRPTLLRAERSLRGSGRPRTADYARSLRDTLYGAGAPTPPGLKERSMVRRELRGAGGLRARLRALAAMPPGGPRGV